MKQKTIEWGTEKISVLFGQVFFPTLLGMLGVSAVTTIDGIFIGHGVGSNGIAAVNICVPLLMVLTGFGLMVGMGSSITASLCLSRGRARMARVNVTQALLFVTAVALPLVGAVMLFPEGTAYWLGSSERLLPMVVDYLVWFAPSMLFTLWTAVAMFALRLDGAPKLAMWCSLLAAFVNVVLDWLFIFPFGWGVRGAAFATSISCLTGTCIAAGYLTFRARHLRLCRLRFGKKAFAFFGRNIGSQCRLGSRRQHGRTVHAGAGLADPGPQREALLRAVDRAGAAHARIHPGGAGDLGGVEDAYHEILRRLLGE